VTHLPGEEVHTTLQFPDGELRQFLSQIPVVRREHAGNVVVQRTLLRSGLAQARQEIGVHLEMLTESGEFRRSNIQARVGEAGVGPLQHIVLDLVQRDITVFDQVLLRQRCGVFDRLQSIVPGQRHQHPFALKAAQLELEPQAGPGHVHPGVPLRPGWLHPTGGFAQTDRQQVRTTFPIGCQPVAA
jgi:hypothetical protein